MLPYADNYGMHAVAVHIYCNCYQGSEKGMELISKRNRRLHQDTGIYQ